MMMIKVAIDIDMDDDDNVSICFSGRVDDNDDEVSNRTRTWLTLLAPSGALIAIPTYY